jgi:hypothetical protein
MNLDDAQRKKVAEWIEEGLKLSDIQKRIASDLGLTLTYMDVRLLVDDLKLVPKDPIPPPEPPPPPSPVAQAKAPSPPKRGESPGQKAAPPEPAGGGLIGGRVTVGVDTVARSGAMVSGNVTFSDGQKGTWYLDQFGRLGVAAEKQGYKPSPADVESFQTELEKELAKFGY